MKRSRIQSVNYGAINYYLQNINEICSLIAKQVNPGATVFFSPFFFTIRCAANARLNLLCNRRRVQGGFAEGSFKMKTHVSAKQEELKERGGHVESWFELLHLLF